ncbi:MAG: hypothetical protein ACYDCL_00400 [Myxococcales bacterium]
MKIAITVAALALACACGGQTGSGPSTSGSGGSSAGASSGESGTSSGSSVGSGSSGGGTGTGTGEASSGSGSSGRGTIGSASSGGTGTSGAGHSSGTTGAATTGRGSSSGGSTGGSSSGSSSGGTSGGSTGATGGASSGSGTGSSSGGTGSGGSSGGTSAADAGFVPTPRTDWPLFTNPQNHPVLSDFQLVTITFSGYPFQAQAESFDEYLLASSWFSAFAGDYGVGPGTVVGAYNLSNYSQGTPQQISDLDIETLLETDSASGTLPAPDGVHPMLYVLYFPSSVTISNPLLGGSCTTWDGYHSEAALSILGGASFSYAVVADCEPGNADELDEITIIASHEIAESSTDPYPLYNSAYRVYDSTSPWLASGVFTEVADVCEGQRITDADAGFTMQQIWSTSAAAANQAPCVPADPARPYFGVSVTPATVQSVAAGSGTSFQVAGWSSGPIGPWDMQLVPEPGPVPGFGYTPGMTWSAATLDNGQSAPLGVTVPSGTASGDTGVVMVYSELPGSYVYSRWPIVVTAQ